MAWICLVLAGLFEIGWAIGLKYTEGWTRLGPSLGVVGAMGASFYFLSLSVQAIPLSVAYAVWVGIGAVGVALFSAFVLGEALTWIHWLCMAMIIAGVVGLKVVALTA